MTMNNIKSKLFGPLLWCLTPHVFWKTLAAFIMSTVGVSNIAFACSVNMSGPMPVCEMPYIAGNERVAVFRFSQMMKYTDIDVIPPKLADQNEYWRMSWLNGIAHHSYVSDIKIGKLKEPVTLVLSSYSAAIIRITGDTKNVDRVIVMGSRRIGPGAIGVVGVDRSKVEYVEVEGKDETRRTVCSAPPRSCVPDQFFELDGYGAGHSYVRSKMKPYAPLRKVDVSSSILTDLEGKAQNAPLLDRADSVDLIEGKDGLEIKLNQETSLRKNADFSTEEFWSARKRYGDYGQFLYTEKMEVDKTIDVESIISPYTFRKSDQLPGWYGIEALHEKGAVLLPTDEAFKRQYEDYVARSDEWNAERKLKMDLILLENIEVLPRELRDGMQTLVVFVPDGITPPKIPNSSIACFLFETPTVENKRSINRPCRNPKNRY